MKNKILKHLPREFPWADRLHCYETLPSTNTLAKELAESGCPTGTVVIAGTQSAGRGRMGRKFSSPVGCGLYFSVVLRTGGEIPMHLTCAAGVAAAKAVERVCGIRPGLKWINDLCFGNRKLGGILTEGAPLGKDPYFVVGIGINCRTPEEGYPEEIKDVAASLAEVAGKDVSPEELAAALMEELFAIFETLYTKKAEIMATYQENCVTLGKEIQVIKDQSVCPAKAISLTQDGGLTVEYPDGLRETVSSGEVSVRGMYGYL